jgi:hypothetical protein
MKKPFAKEGPESAIAVSRARASAFRPLPRKGAAHSRREGGSDPAHGGNIGARWPVVNARPD